jgi:16S rRNA (adenine1518-N6/adenine1519-N6)-dimethyltransferase
VTIRLLTRTEIRNIARELDFRPRKALGQNFVHDANTLRRIVSSSGIAKNDHVLEVGPGLGSLTLAILDRGAAVTAIEIDPLLAARLPKTVAEHSHSEIHRLTVVNQDVLTLRRTDLAQQPTAVVANLPYNVSVPVLLHFMENFPSVRSGVVMVQAEVGHRLAASPGSKIYGSPSVKAAWYGTWRIAGTVSRQVFWPVPNVDSVLVAFERHATAVGEIDQPDEVNEPGDEALRRRTFVVVDAAFGQRRKMLRQALSGVFGSSEAASAALERAGIAPTRRGEELVLDEFVRLASHTHLP